MSLSNSRQAYEDCYDMMDKALESSDGVRVGFEDREQAVYLRMRMNQARQLDRKFNTGRYNGDDPRRRHSEYDVLSMRIRVEGGMYWIYIEKRQKPQVIEEIKADEPIKQTITHRRF
jgi:hypothetical protein